MSRLTPLKPVEVFRKLRRLGYVGPISGGRHMRMVNLQTSKIIPVPVHGSSDVGVGLIREIIKEADITRDEWIEL